MPQASQRGRHQEVLQPVGVILHAVEVVTGRHPRRLVPPQARPIRVTVPLQRHGPYGEARAVGGAVPRAPGVEPPVLGVEPPIDGMGGAVGLRTIRGRSAVGPTATPLHPPRGHQPAAGQRRPRGHAPQALRQLPCGRRLVDLPGRVESLVAPRARTGLFPLQDRVEQAPHHFARGKESPPRLTCRFPAVGADRARLGVWRERLGCLGTRAIAPLHGSRIGRLDHAHPQATAPADRGRDRALLLRSPGQLLLGPQVAGPLVRVCHGGAQQRRAAAGPPGPLPAQGIAAKDGGQGVKRPPPLPPGEGCFDRLGARHHGGHDTRGAQGKDGPRCEPCDPAPAQRLCDRHVAVVQGKTLVHLVRTQCRVLAPPLGQRLPRLCWVVDIRALRHCTRTRQTARRIAHGWSACASCCAG